MYSILYFANRRIRIKEKLNEIYLKQGWYGSMTRPVTEISGGVTTQITNVETRIEQKWSRKLCLQEWWRDFEKEENQRYCDVRGLNDERGSEDCSSTRESEAKRYGPTTTVEKRRRRGWASVVRDISPCSCIGKVGKGYKLLTGMKTVLWIHKSLSYIVILLLIGNFTTRLRRISECSVLSHSVHYRPWHTLP